MTTLTPEYCLKCRKQLNDINTNTFDNRFCMDCMLQICKTYKKNNKGLYFIQAKSRYESHIKIGISRDIDKRLKQLQIGNPHELELVLVIQFKHMSVAKLFERDLHILFRTHRLEGEWFENIEDYVKLLKYTHKLESNEAGFNNVITTVEDMLLEPIPDKKNETEPEKMSEIAKLW